MHWRRALNEAAYSKATNSATENPGSVDIRLIPRYTGTTVSTAATQKSALGSSVNCLISSIITV